jgi:hypothetical protein
VGTSDTNGIAVSEKDGATVENYANDKPGVHPTELPGREVATEMDPGKGGNRHPQELSGYHKPQELST